MYMTKMSYIVLLLVIPLLSFGQSIRVYAASDLRYVLEDILVLYQSRHPEDRVEVVYGSSGKGYVQILNGAPFDVFMSADMEYVERLYQKGYVITKPRAYAVGRLVLCARKDSNLNPSDFPKVLFDQRVRKIAIANPEHAPYGRAAKEVLESFGLLEKIKGKIVLGENISQAASFVYSGSAQVGFIALSLALSPQMQKLNICYLIPQSLHTKILQGYGITKVGQGKAQVERFYKFIASSQAKAILKKYGFEEP